MHVACVVPAACQRHGLYGQRAPCTYGSRGTKLVRLFMVVPCRPAHVTDLACSLHATSAKWAILAWYVMAIAHVAPLTVDCCRHSAWMTARIALCCERASSLLSSGAHQRAWMTRFSLRHALDRFQLNAIDFFGSFGRVVVWRAHVVSKAWLSVFCPSLCIYQGDSDVWRDSVSRH